MDVHYEVSGTGEPVALVSGLSQVGRRWHRVTDRLSDEFQVITFDNRETGRTGPCPDGFTLTDIAEDVLAVLTALGHEQFFLAGISMGGMISQEVIRQAPDRVRAAALLATHGGTPTSVQPPDLGILMPVSEDPMESARVLWSRLSGPGFADANPEVIEEEARLSVESPTPVDGVMRQIQAITGFDPGDALVGTSVPVVVGHGDHDPLVPYENGTRLASKLGCELVTYAGSGHGLEFERADEVAELLRSHFRAVA